ncbi:hypothetical protein [Zooshikella sp. RANM57]|uniref:hypothetical protein n=1 Tax=Zooshikella sp. RANM57 TaxID=3425863 RepID=UPI003D6DEF6D
MNIKEKWRSVLIVGLFIAVVNSAYAVSFYNGSHEYYWANIQSHNNVYWPWLQAKEKDKFVLIHGDISIPLNIQGKDHFLYMPWLDYPPKAGLHGVRLNDDNLSKKIYGDFNGDGYGDAIYISNFYAFVMYAKPNSQVPSIKSLNHLKVNGGIDLFKAYIQVQDRNRDGKDDLIIRLPGRSPLVAFADDAGNFPRAELDVDIGIYNGPSVSPSKFCKKGFAIEHPAGTSSQVYFDDVCQTAYVSPPVLGTTKVQKLIPSANASMCQKLEQAQESTNSLTKALVDLVKRYNTSISSLDVTTALELFAKRLLDADNLLQVAQQYEDEAKLAWENKLREQVLAELDLDECVMKVEPPQLPDCKQQSAALAQLSDLIKTLEVKYNYLGNARLSARKQYDIALADYLEKLGTLVDSDHDLSALVTKYDEIQDKELNLYKEFAALEGGYAQIDYQLNWGKILEQYRQRNNRLGVSWQKLPLTGLELVSSVNDQDIETTVADRNLTLPAVLFSELQGNIANYQAKDLTGGDKAIKEHIAKTPAAHVNAAENYSGKVGLSLAGYCPYSESQAHPADKQRLAAHLIPYVKYDYEVQARRGYVARYNLYELISTTVKVKKKRKWFKKKKKVTIIRHVKTLDWSKVDFSQNTGEFAYTPLQQQQIREEVRNRLMTLASNKIGILYGQPGAQCTKETMDDCSAGFWLGQQSGPNGDSKAIANFKTKNNTWVTERVYGIGYITREGWVNFSK